MDRYNDDPQPQYGTQWDMPTPKKKSHTARNVVLVLFAVVVAFCGIAGVVLGRTASKTPTTQAHASSSPPAPMQHKTSATIGEGTWIVGKDVKAGKYRTTGAADSDVPLCYWDVRKGSETGEFADQGAIDKADEPGIVTLKSGEYFKTSGCAVWSPMTSASLKLVAYSPLSHRKVYVVVGGGLSGWPISSAEAWIDRYTGSDWVMAKSCPASAYRCVFVKKDNGLSAPILAATYNYNSSRVTIRIDVAYAKARGYTSQSRRKNIVAHEFGHAGFIRAHSSSCGNLMYAHANCIGWKLTASQRAILRKH
jgi:hypothetical protein